MLGTRGIPAAYSGFETAVEHLAERFSARGHEVTVYCRTHMTERRARHAGARLVHLPTIRSKHLDTLAHTMLSTAHLAMRAAGGRGDLLHRGQRPRRAPRATGRDPGDPPDRRPGLRAREVVAPGARLPAVWPSGSPPRRPRSP